METWVIEAAIRIATEWLNAGGRDRLLAAFKKNVQFRTIPSCLKEQVPTEFNSQIDGIVRDLFIEAFTNGLSRVPEFIARYETPMAGSTAEIVVKSTLEMAFFVKVDTSPKLADEARKLQNLHTRTDIPEEFRACFPHIYASKVNCPPFGYIMESFSEYTGLEKILFNDNPYLPDMKLMGERILTLLFSAYKQSLTDIVKPNLNKIYLDRIKSRLDEASRLCDQMESLITTGATVNGVICDAPAKYLSRIAGRLTDIEPGFSTFVHGDAHPENILVRIASDRIDIKFIDPKEWPLGDYIFDIGKLIHYLEVTGPVECMVHSSNIVIDSDSHTLSYTLTRPDQLNDFIRDVRQRVAKFVKGFDDPYWETRLSLSMASNLLGLPAGRLVIGKKESAFLFFGEGLLWLQRAAKEIEEKIPVKEASKK